MTRSIYAAGERVIVNGRLATVLGTQTALPGLRVYAIRYDDGVLSSALPEDMRLVNLRERANEPFSNDPVSNEPDRRHRPPHDEIGLDARFEDTSPGENAPEWSEAHPLAFLAICAALAVLIVGGAVLLTWGL